MACLFVLIQHVTYFACLAKGRDYEHSLPLNFGGIGVCLFFVISGYVMGGCLDQGRRFMWNRVIRIYPPYWIAVGATWFLLAVTHYEWHFDWWTLALLPTDSLRRDVSVPYWTLCYEMAFYCTLYLLILCQLTTRQIRYVCLVWIVAIMGAEWFRPTADMTAPGWWILLSPLSLYFIVGLLVSAYGRTLTTIPMIYLLGSAAVLWVLNSSIRPVGVPPELMLAACYSLILLAANRIRVPHLLARLGDFSYGAYLIHMLIIMGAKRELVPLAPNLSFTALWLALMLVAIAGGVAYGWSEHEIHLRFFKRRLKKMLVPREGSLAAQN